MSTRHDVLITAAELARLLAAGEPVTLLDVRWTLTEPDGTAAYQAGHLPGAVYVSLDDELSDHSVPGRGRHPLPSGAALQQAARRWGVRRGVPVVVYDDWNRAGSARAWWVLTAAGIPDVRILDGGLAAWTGELHTGTVVPEPGDIAVEHDDLYHGARKTITADNALGAPTLLDARPPERYRGDSETVDPVAGHIPGAINLPSTGLLGGDGTLLPDADLTALFDARGVGSSDVAVYCGSGVTASLVVAALATAGVDAALFPGSWSQWSSEPTRPVALGNE
ncbi:sulfurtransferase [Mycobacterium sp. ITM-2016-00317]|uniref:sulfurtransferase n=1 Tax=Mycobacterium sp. ITM-2016-00317 TaxID=2099694 RepID=UPI00287FE61C|nr:sulfurtransferase [Mycobacterium sp. ITM-2016-00317]WNG88590.1 sulfurtransferase [Mycobacterium sp. ITM-2016-00317]